MDFLAVLSGFGVGAIVGMTGVGGGSLMTPLLMAAFGLPAATAIGTDMWFAGITKSGGAWAHRHLGQVDLRVAGLLLAGSLPAAVATIAFMHDSGIGIAGTGALTIALGLALMLTAVSVLYRQHWAAVGLRLERRLTARRRIMLTVASGVLLGVLVSLSSIGAGAIGATFLLLLHPRLQAQRIVGTDIAHAVPLTLLAGIGHATLGHVEWSLLAPLLVGSLPGICMGARLTRSMPEPMVRGLLCLSLAGAGFKLLS